jgi:hypothetical protein
MMNTESDWSSGNRYQEPVPAEKPQATARYSWDWPENLAPEWTPPPWLVTPSHTQTWDADSNRLGGGSAYGDELEADYWRGDRVDQEPAEPEVTDRRPTPANDESDAPEQADEPADYAQEQADEPTDCTQEQADYEPDDGSDDHLEDGEQAGGAADWVREGQSVDDPARRPGVEGLAEDGPGDDEESWPGVAPAAGWFLRAPGEGGGDGTTAGETGADGTTPGGIGGDDAKAGGISGNGVQAIGASAVPWPRREPDPVWLSPSGFPVPTALDGGGATGGNAGDAGGTGDAGSANGAGSTGDAGSAGTWNGTRPVRVWTVSGAGLPAEPVVGATRALWGRAGGPGFQPGRPGAGPRRAVAEPTPWQKSQGLWRDSGIDWDEQPQPAAPTVAPRRDLRPSPLPPRRILAAPLPPPERYAGRHVGAGSGPGGPAEPVNGAWPGRTQVTLSAPVYAEPEPEERDDRGALRVDDGPDMPWDRSFGWERASGGPGAGDTLLLEEEPQESRRPRGPRNRVARRTAAIVVPVIVLVAVAAMALALLTGHGPRFGQLASSQPQEQAPALPQALTAAAFGTYPGQQQRGVFQTVNRIVAAGNTIVTMGSQTSDGIVRQQFFVSTNAGATWRLAPVQSPGGGQAPLGYAASLLAGGPGGWAAIGPQALWTSQNGQSWTLAATHGIAPQLPGDSVWVMTRTAQGFLAAGNGSAGRGASQAVLWTSADGVTWHRMTAAQLGLAAAGQQVLNISYATWLGDDTLISGEVAGNGTTYAGVWLSTNGGSSWTRVTIPVDHGAGTSIAGLAYDSAGLLAVRPGRTPAGAADGVAYFSPNGRSWQYSGILGAAGGWTPGVVKGSVYGFVVAGTSAAGRLVAYTSTGSGASWQPTGSLGDAADESVVGATVAPAGTIVAVGYTTRSTIGQQAMLIDANTAGTVRQVSLAGVPGGVIPELTVDGLAVAGGREVAVGSADGYPAVWQKTPGGSWALVTPLTSMPAGTGLTALTGVTDGSAGWLAVGAPGPYVATSANGTTWQFATGSGSITDDLAGVAAVATAAGPAGYIIVGKLVAPGGNCVADVWWSPNLTSWVRAHDVNDATGSSQVLAVAASAHGFVSAGSHDGRPAVWTTTDGRSWTTIVLPMPAGAKGAVLQQIAISGDRVVALGQETTAAGTLPIAELSVDGGTTWEQVPFGSPGTDTAFTAIAAGPGGFAATGQFGEPGQREVAVWTSGAGTVWSPSQISGLTGAQAGGSYLLTALAPAGSGVTGIGSIATQQTLEPFTVTLPSG